jgi:hypothetical protein
MQFHYRRFDQQFGPISWEALVAEARQGGLYPTDLVWTETWPAWQEARQVPGLLPSAPPPAQSPYARLQQPYQSPGGDDGPLMRAMLPVGRSFWAIVAGYLGLGSVLLLPAPFAIMFGILAIRDIKANPHLHGLGRAWFAIVMGTLGSAALALMMVSMLAPGWLFS